MGYGGRKLRLLLEQEDVRRVGEYFPFIIPVQAMNNLFVFMFLCFAIHVVQQVYGERWMFLFVDTGGIVDNYCLSFHFIMLFQFPLTNCPAHIVLCFCFVFLRLVQLKLLVSLDFPFLIALRCSLTFIFVFSS